VRHQKILAVALAFPCCGVGFSLLWERPFLAVALAFPCCRKSRSLLWRFAMPRVEGAAPGKKNKIYLILFCIVLAYSYLCTRKIV
jgi:hypothetical protein